MAGIGGLLLSTAFAIVVGLSFSLSCKKTVTAVILTAFTWVFGAATCLLPILIMREIYQMQYDTMLLSLSLPLSVLLAVTTIIAFIRSRQRGFGPCLTLFLYMTLTVWTISIAFVYGMSGGNANSIFDEIVAVSFFLPTASLLYLVDDISASALFFLPAQVLIIFYLTIVSLRSLRAQARRAY